MRKVSFIIAFLGFFLMGFGQTQISNICYSNSVNIFDMLEISFDVGASYTNPYDPNIVSIYAVFVSPTNEHQNVNAFYYEGYNFTEVYSNDHDDTYEQAVSNGDNGWRIRFTPNSAGNWSFVIHGIDANGHMQIQGSLYNTFTCNSVSNTNGFISKANNRFLKREVVKDGQKKCESFFPVGPNVAWYNCLDYNSYQLPKGIYQYEKYIDSLSGNANYMRIFLSRYQSLSLYGPEYTQNVNEVPTVYFDSTINQKDAAELDYIINYALQHNVTIMPCIFNHADFRHTNYDPNDVWVWGNNPYNTFLNVPSDFFTDGNAKRIAKKLIRYIVARWGYATNIVSWELWNEVDNVYETSTVQKTFELNVKNWHDEMANYIRGIDSFNHCISTSMGSKHTLPGLYNIVFETLDFVMEHNYQNIQNADSRLGFTYVLYNKTQGAFTLYPLKPFFMGEYGFSQSQPPYYIEKDPHGIDLHNSLWSSLFSTSIGPASFWRWATLYDCGVFKRFTPLLNFSRNLPILSGSFIANHTGKTINHKLEFENGLRTYYMYNSTQDTIYGWSQDTIFAYTSLRKLADTASIVSSELGDYWCITGGAFDTLGYVYTLDPAKRPAPSSNNNSIKLKITNQPVGSRYEINWYNSETGFLNLALGIHYCFVQQDALGDKFITFQFPPSIRDIRSNTINNTFGDVVFSLILRNPFEKNNHPK